MSFVVIIGLLVLPAIAVQRSGLDYQWAAAGGVLISALTYWVPGRDKPMLAKVLWALGFHWNQRRGARQHPCCKFDPPGAHPTDPRTKHRTYFPAEVLPV